MKALIKKMIKKGGDEDRDKGDKDKKQKTKEAEKVVFPKVKVRAYTRRGQGMLALSACRPSHCPKPMPSGGWFSGPFRWRGAMRQWP